jgi:transcriptional regulator with XRE-family HTH domain
MEGDLQRRVGVNLRAWRRQRRLSQEKLAEFLEVHRTYVGHIERGQRNINLKTVERIAEKLELDPEQLLGDDPAAVAASGTDFGLH